MKKLIRLEHLALGMLGVILYWQTGYSMFAFLLLLLVPDIGMIGYLVGPKVGAITYNFTHSGVLAVLLFTLGMILFMPELQAAGAIVLAHLYFDRALGFGWKYSDAFKHTDLGWIGSK